MANVQVTIPTIIPQSSQTFRDSALRVIVSYVGWLIVFFVTGWISRLLIPKVRTLKPKEQMFWQLAMVRGICGMLSLRAVYMIFIDKRLARDYSIASTDESWAFIAFIIGFFVFEELTLTYFDIKYRTFSKELHIHHFFAFTGYFLAAYYGTGHYYAVKTFVLEASTPFSCVCWCLLKLKLEKTKIWKINQWILIYVFHLRTIYELSVWYDVYQDWDNLKQNIQWPAIINLLTGLTAVTFWLTPYWTYKKTVQYFHPTDWNAEVEKRKKDEIDKTS